MVYNLPERNGNQRYVGIAFVVGIHILLVIGLISGLNSRIALQLPTTVVTIFQDEQKPLAHEDPPPPPPKPAMVEPDLPTLPIPLVPITEVAPVVIATQPVTQVTSDAGAGSAISPEKPTVSAQVACPNSDAVRASAAYPIGARREGIQGDVLARFVVGTNGQIKNIVIVRSADRALNPAVMTAVRQFQCVAQASEVLVEVPFTFRLS